MENENQIQLTKSEIKTHDTMIYINGLADKLSKEITFPDITFKFSDNKKVSCHRWILAKDSQYFTDLFTGHPENKDIDLSDNKPEIMSKYEIFILYLVFLYISVDENNIDKNIWYNLFEFGEYINSIKINNIYQYVHKSNTYKYLLNYITRPTTFIYEKIDLIDRITRNHVIGLSKLSLHATYVFLNSKFRNKLHINQYNFISNNIIFYRNPIQIDLILFVASKYKYKQHKLMDKMKDVDIRKLCSECQYILFDPHLQDFIKEVELAKKK